MNLTSASELLRFRFFRFALFASMIMFASCTTVPSQCPSTYSNTTKTTTCSDCENYFGASVKKERNDLGDTFLQIIVDVIWHVLVF